MDDVWTTTNNHYSCHNDLNKIIYGVNKQQSSARQSRGSATALWVWTWRSKTLITWYANSLQFLGEPRKGVKRKPKGANGSQNEASSEAKGCQKDTKMDPIGCQNEKGTSKSTLCGTGANKLGQRMRNEWQCMPKWSQHRCHQSLQINDKTGNEQVHEQHVKWWQNDARMEPFFFRSIRLRKGNFSLPM